MTYRDLISELYGGEPFVMPADPRAFLKSLMSYDHWKTTNPDDESLGNAKQPAPTYWRNFLVSLELPSHTKLSHYSLDMLSRMADLADLAESRNLIDPPPKLYNDP
jgi:hypothetical protein